MKLKQVILLLVFAVALLTLNIVYSQGTKPTKPVVPKTREALVQSLPKGIEGVELVGGLVRVKSGYKWVKQANGSVVAARIGRGGGSGEWGCKCSVGGNCDTVPTPFGGVYCSSDCFGPCYLNVQVGGHRTDIIKYLY